MASTHTNISKLMQSLLSEASENSSLLDELLRDEGFEPQQLEIRGIQKIKKLKFTHRVALNRVEQSNLFERAVAIFKEVKAETRSEILNLLQQKAPSLQFRNLDKLDEVSLREILNETDLLDLMAKIKKEQ